jgi:hypothetical protein
MQCASLFVAPASSLRAHRTLTLPRHASSSKKPVSIISYLSLGRYLSAPQRTPVWLFVPNQIGYLRALLALWAFVYALPHSWGKTAMAAAAADAPSFVALYFASYILDAADGMAARALGQTSAFGALLDMVR